MMRVRKKLYLAILLVVVIGCSSQTTTPESTSNQVPVSTANDSNIALESEVTASQELPDFPSRLAIDGIEQEDNNWWSAGTNAPQWIELHFPGPINIARIELTPGQSPAGNTVHILYACDQAGDLAELQRLEGFTEDGIQITFEPAEPIAGIDCLRIETIESPSWVAWREIKVFGTASDDVAAEATISPALETASIIFHNGNVLSMDASLTTEDAIALANETILRVGSNDEILSLARPETILIDLQGRTLMPGIVDAHTHVLNDAEGTLGLDLVEAQQLAIENGITTIGDAFISPEFLGQMQTLESEGRLQLRTSLYLLYTDNCGNLQGDWWRGFPPTREFGEVLRIGGLKIFTDGGSCGLPALSEGPNGGKGDLWLTQEELNAAVAEADAAGYQVILHALGDQAVEQAQNAISYALNGRPNILRHRIDHNAIVTPDLMARYDQIDIVTVLFGYFPICPYNPSDPFLQMYEWPWRDLLDANPDLHVAWHGDYPWVGPISPFMHLYYLVTRQTLREDGSVCEPQPWSLKQAITVKEALGMMTTGSAYALFRDTEVGSLEPGKLADLIVISANPLMTEPNELKDIEVWMTMIGGETLFCAPGHEAVCP